MKKILYFIYSIAYWSFFKRKTSKPMTDFPEEVEGKTLHILANGRSSENFISDIQTTEENVAEDFLFMNNMIIYQKELCFKIKPRYYAVIDPVYWTGRNTFLIDEISYDKFNEIIEEIDWDIYIITTVTSNFHFENKHVHQIFLSSVECNKVSKYILTGYRKNYCLPGLNNVAIAAIYFGITWQYKHIQLWGLDFDFIKEWEIDGNNHLYVRSKHSYDDKADTWHENRGRKEGETIGYCKQLIETFRCFNALRDYAAFEGVKILNMNPKSLLDMFEKYVKENGNDE